MGVDIYSCLAVFAVTWSTRFTRVPTVVVVSFFTATAGDQRTRRRQRQRDPRQRRQRHHCVTHYRKARYEHTAIINNIPFEGQTAFKLPRSSSVIHSSRLSQRVGKVVVTELKFGDDPSQDCKTRSESLLSSNDSTIVIQLQARPKQ